MVKTQLEVEKRLADWYMRQTAITAIALEARRNHFSLTLHSQILTLTQTGVRGYILRYNATTNTYTKCHPRSGTSEISADDLSTNLRDLINHIITTWRRLNLSSNTELIRDVPETFKNPFSKYLPNNYHPAELRLRLQLLGKLAGVGRLTTSFISLPSPALSIYLPSPSRHQVLSLTRSGLRNFSETHPLGFIFSKTPPHYFWRDGTYHWDTLELNSDELKFLERLKE